jgi:hypothetical protein
MRLNLPIYDQLQNSQNILIAGMGGGFDIFCGLPLYFELKQQGLNVHLANYSFSLLAGLDDGINLNKGLVGVNADMTTHMPYFPELHLTQWFREKRNEEVTIWCFDKTGVRPLLENYQLLTEHLKIDAIVLVDGGVDSLMRGNEPEVGTVIEDTISLCAVNELKNIPIRLTACIGFGAEQEMTYAHVLENISALVALDAFLGSCSLLKQMESYKSYEDAVMYVQEKPGQDSSVINSSIVSAVQGHYGNYHLTGKTSGSRLWISSLMPIYWFFDMRTIARRNLLISLLRWTDNRNEALREFIKARNTMAMRKHEMIPLK